MNTISSPATPLVIVTPVSNSIDVAVMSSPIVFDPPPFWTNVLLTTMSELSPVVNVPVFVTVIAPPTVLPAPLSVRSVPVKAKSPVNVNTSANVVVPLPATCVNRSASTVLLNVTSAALVTVMSPLPKSPTAPVTVTSPPAPATNLTDSSSALFNVALNVMS